MNSQAVLVDTHMSAADHAPSLDHGSESDSCMSTIINWNATGFTDHDRGIVNAIY